MMRVSLLLLLLLSHTAQATDIVANHALMTRLWSVLESDNVEYLDEQDRSLLSATLALKENNHQKALSMLASPVNSQDPLISLLKAEAYRRAALEAVTTAGSYAKHPKTSQRLFAAIDLSPDLSEADVRLQAFAEKVDGTTGYPLDLLLLNDTIQTVFLVDKTRSRLFVYQRNNAGELIRVADEYVVTGANRGDKKSRGDARTPNGIYRFTSVRHDSALTARYGPVVFPIDYPNALDQLHGKTGDGIWMHGYPHDVKRRPPQDTRGCFALPNEKLKQMEAYVTPGKSWVIIGENFIFDAKEKQSNLLESIQQAIDVWRQDWSSLDTSAYLSHYHKSFRSGKYNLKRWRNYKTKVNQRKKFIDVKLTHMSILHDPTLWDEGEVTVVEFSQHYQSNNYKDISQKRLYLTRDNHQAPWKILIEESIEP